MEPVVSFGEILEAIDQISLEEQETLLDIVRRRMSDKGRKRLLAEIAEAKTEHASGKCRTATAQELMNEILS